MASKFQRNPEQDELNQRMIIEAKYH